MDGICKQCCSAYKFCICGRGASHAYAQQNGEGARDYRIEYFKLLRQYDELKAEAERDRGSVSGVRRDDDDGAGEAEMPKL